MMSWHSPKAGDLWLGRRITGGGRLYVPLPNDSFLEGYVPCACLARPGGIVRFPMASFGRVLSVVVRHGWVAVIRRGRVVREGRP